MGRHINKINSYLKVRKLHKLFKTSTPQKIFYFLRKQDPFLFEEIVLTSLKKRGCKIVRNKSYIGDGGIDGRFKTRCETWVYCQMKRYRNHVNLKHLEKFLVQCRLDKKFEGGIFVHTGKTGKNTYQQMKSQNICIISGRQLIQLLCTKEPMQLHLLDKVIEI